MGDRGGVVEIGLEGVGDEAPEGGGFRGGQKPNCRILAGRFLTGMISAEQTRGSEGGGVTAKKGSRVRCFQTQTTALESTPGAAVAKTGGRGGYAAGEA